MKGASAFKKRLLKLAGNDHANAINALIADVKKSGTKNVAFKQFNIPAAGVSKENGDLYIADNHTSLADIIFVTLHESAHQLQYRKYGTDYALNVWFEMLTDGAAKVAPKIKQVEDVANRYAMMKFKKYQAMFGIPNISYNILMNTFLPVDAYEQNMVVLCYALKRKGVTTKEQLKTEMDNFLN